MALPFGNGTTEDRGAEPHFTVPGLSITDELLEDGSHVLTVTGELDMATGPVLGQRIRRPLFWKDVSRLVVDLSGVEFLDSSGTSALVLSYAHADALGRRLAFICPDGSVLRRLRAYGLEERLPLYSTREEALSA